MPALENPRHERFAQELAKGKTADEAYEAAGLSPVKYGDHAGFYVYALIDPRDGLVFYIGKGKGKRAGVHWQEVKRNEINNARKSERLRSIMSDGQSVRVDVLADGMTSPNAYRIEQAFIRAIGFDILTNVQAGTCHELFRLLAEVRLHINDGISFSTWKRENPEKPSHWYWDVTHKFLDMEGVLERAINGSTA